MPAATHFRRSRSLHTRPRRDRLHRASSDSRDLKRKQEQRGRSPPPSFFGDPLMYATINDIRAQLPEEILIQLTDDAGTGLVDEAQVNEAIAGADSTIDGYCGSRYEVPFTDVPTLIPRICVDIAVFN